MELHSGHHPGNTTSHQQAQNLTVGRLNAAQPPPPSPIKQMGKQRDQPSVPGALSAQRGTRAGGLRDMVTPTGSTQAQFQNSAQNLPQPRTTVAHYHMGDITLLGSLNHVEMLSNFVAPCKTTVPHTIRKVSLHLDGIST
ncbi:hypothetical protein B0J13DRAFT_293348, partial [Dactylonectria estremocensis]